MLRKMFDSLLILMSPDDGGAGGDPPADPPAGEPPSDPPEGEPGKVQKGMTENMPTYATQLSPEFRETHKEALEAYGKDHKVTDALTELMENKTSLTAAKEQLSRAIVKPKKGDEADLKRFMKDMDIPETPAGYELEKGEAPDNIHALFQEEALKTGLTQTQAQRQWALFNTISKQGKNILDDANKQLKDTFNARMNEAAGGEEKSSEAINLATKYLVRFGDEAILNDLKTSGMLFNTKYMMKCAEHEELLGDPRLIDGSEDKKGGKGEKKGKMTDYDPEFEKTYGKRS